MKDGRDRAGAIHGYTNRELIESPWWIRLIASPSKRPTDLTRTLACDVIAEGVLAAVRETNLAVPLVVRLEGTNAELGKKIIKDSGLNVVPANDLDDAAQKIVAAVKGK